MLMIQNYGSFRIIRTRQRTKSSSMEGPYLEPTQITVTVFSARHLQGRRKGEVCHASVVFGVGKDYYMTETVESTSPQWDQEARINVAGKASSAVKFKLRDKEHTIGVATKSIAEITSHKTKQWLPLLPHKSKSHEAVGEILVEFHVSESRPSDLASPTSSHTSSQEDLLHAKPAGIRERLSIHKRSPSLTKSRVINKPSTDSPPSLPSQHIERRSGSDYELHAKRSLRSTYSETNIRGEVSLRRKLSVGEIHASSHGSPGASPRRGSLENPLMPQVTGISPREGPVAGGQRVVLRGSCLGESRRDVVKVVLAGVDCTESLEYHSPTKLVVTTLPRSTPGTGPVLVETSQGGEGLSSIKFTFAGEGVANEPEVSGISPREGPLSGGQRVVLRGSNLGEARSDLVRVWIADVDCSDSVEYFSPSKLVVTTAPRETEGSGAVLVETVRGGVGVSSLTFTYVQAGPAPLLSLGGAGRLPSLSSPSSSSNTIGGGEGNYRKRSKQQDMELEFQTEIKALKQQVRDLKDDNVQLKNENQSLREYIDKLLLNIIATSPSILEIKNSLATSRGDACHPSNNGSFVQ